MFDVVDASLSMLLDVYIQSELQDEETGSIKREWNYQATLSCYARATMSSGANVSARSGDRQSIGTKYENIQLLEIRTINRLSLRNKITNIRGLDGKVIWSELNYPSETPTVFEILGSAPMTDPFGNVVAWNSVAKRSENQQIGI